MSDFLYLPNWRVTDVTALARQFEAHATYSVEPDACPKCGTVGQIYRHGSKPVSVRDAPVRGRQVVIELDRRRYRCRSCLATFLQPIPDLDDQRRMTVRCREYVQEQCLLRPFTQVADDIGLDEKTVRQIAADFITELDAQRTIRAPKILGIDEVHLLKRPRAIFTSISGRGVIDLLDDRGQRQVAHWLSHLPERERVEVVAMDMWAPYKRAVRAVLPQAAVVVDKFHIVRMAGHALDQVRKAVGQQEGIKGRRGLMRSRFLLLTHAADLTPMNRMKLDGMLANVAGLAPAYAAKEAFYGIWQADTKAQARKAYATWLRTLPAALERPYKPLVTAMHNWEAEIFAYWDHRVTNAFTEAVNGVVKMANRLGRGYSFEVIRARILHRKPVGDEPDSWSKCEGCLRIVPQEYMLPADTPPASPGGTRYEVMNSVLECPQCRKLHTIIWFKRHGDSTRKSE